MDISGRILREVEFRDRLRGYDTDEVDEFLEKVAVGVDELEAEVASLRERLEHAPPQTPAPAATEIAFPDDESIRRTLVLAQRTADLAIKEAEQEAEHLLEEARTRAEALITRAEDEAQRARDAAEFDLQARVTELSERREHLEREVGALTDLLRQERDRLGDALSSALRFVNDTLTVSDELASVTRPEAAVADAPEPAPVRPAPRFDFTDATGTGTEGTDIDIEAEITEDAEIAFGGSRPTAERPPERRGEAAVDADEELWERWAKSSPLGEDETTGAEDPFGPERRGE